MRDIDAPFLFVCSIFDTAVGDLRGCKLSVVKMMVMWSREGGSPDETRLEQTHTHSTPNWFGVIWAYNNTL